MLQIKPGLKLAAIFWLSCTWLQVASSQTEWRFSGYLTTLPFYQGGNDLGFVKTKPMFVDLTRIRLRPALYLGPNTRLSMEYEANSIYQSADIRLSPSYGKTNRQYLDWHWLLLEKDRWMLSHAIDRLYLRRDFRFGNLVIGRQRVAWGSGRIWNPTDLFNPINPATFDKVEKDGADLLTAQFYLGSLTDLTLVHNPQNRWRKNNAGARLRTNYHTYDLSIMGGYFDERLIIGGDFAGNLITAGLRGELIISAKPEKPVHNYVRYILGLDYQFNSWLYTLAEYQFNGRGISDPNRYDLESLLAGQIINLNRDYLFLQSMFQLHALVNGGLGWNANLNDGSGFFTLNLSYGYRENLELQLGGQLFYGTSPSEYGFYAGAFYLRGTCYF